MLNKLFIFVKETEYSDYCFKSNKSNQVRKFWLNIYHSLPIRLKKEVKGKPTELILQPQEEFKISGAMPYRFETQGASPQLKQYLEQFTIFVETETQTVQQNNSLLKQNKFYLLNHTK